MMKMTEAELASVTDYMVRNSVTESGTFNDDNETYLNYYKGELFGDELDGRSKVVSTDVRDLVESDMPSLARVFLGAGDPVEFKPVGQTREAIQEAREKQALVGHIIRYCRDSFRTQHDWLKASEFQSVSALEYGVEETKTPRVKRYENVTEEELAAIIADIETDKDVSKAEVVETDDNEDGTLSALIRVTFTKLDYFMRCVPVEDFIISRNAWNKNDAEVIGKRFRKTRGQLVSEGFSKDLVDSLPASNEDDATRDSLKAIRYKNQGGEDHGDDSYAQWANQEIEGVDVYALIDFDGDGIAERRHIVKVGKVILENEPFDHVPYSIISSMLMPNNIIGLPRAELAKQYQRINSVLWRQTLDNMYQVNQPRTAYTDAVDIDALLDHQFGGAVHVEGTPANEIFPIVTPYIGDKALQVIQFMEGKKQASTGNPIGNQALEADQLHKETATRFKGMDDANKAKIELVARVIAEVGYRDLWEGIAWFAAHYQNTELELRVLGKELTIDPTSWKYDHYLCAKVGTGSGDDEQKVQNMTGLYQIQTALQQLQSPLVDNTKVYNTLAEITTALGQDAVSEFFNNPEEPAQIVEAERDALRGMVQQMQAQLQQANPLADAEQVKGEYQMQMKMMEQKQQAQMEMLKLQQKQKEEIDKLQAGFAEQLNEMKFKYDELATKTRLEYDKLETASGTDIKGEGTE